MYDFEVFMLINDLIIKVIKCSSSRIWRFFSNASTLRLVDLTAPLNYFNWSVVKANNLSNLYSWCDFSRVLHTYVLHWNKTRSNIKLLQRFYLYALLNIFNIHAISLSFLLYFLLSHSVCIFLLLSVSRFLFSYSFKRDKNKRYFREILLGQIIVKTTVVNK